MSGRVVIIGGGPAGSTAAEHLAREGVSVVLIDPLRSRPKPCGGAVPPILLEEFRIPSNLVVFQTPTMAVVAPSGRKAQFTSDAGPISSIHRETFDPCLRQRASEAGAEIMQGRCLAVSRSRDGYELAVGTADRTRAVRAEVLLAADGARSVVARCLGFPLPRRVFAYQERVVPPGDALDRHPQGDLGVAPGEMDVRYTTHLDRDPQGDLGVAPTKMDLPYTIHLDDRFSPDRYAWVFPKGDHLTVGTMWREGGNPRESIRSLRAESGLGGWRTILREGCPVAYGLAPKLVVGRVLLLGDAGGLAAPGTGEGIYYAMKSGALAAETVLECAERDRFGNYGARVRDHFAYFFMVLSVLERWFLHSRSQRERLAGLLEREDIHQIAFRAYMNKGFMGADWRRLVRAAIRHGRWLFVR